jgi:hypothetical protein
VTITASASDSVGVAKVEFYQGSTLLGSVTTSPYQYTWDITALADGTYSIGIKIYDTAGNTYTPSSVSLIKGTNSSTSGGVTTTYGGSGKGCYTRTEITTFMSNYGCTSACNTTFDVNGDARIDHLDLNEVLGSMCHE